MIKKKKTLVPKAINSNENEDDELENVEEDIDDKIVQLSKKLQKIFKVKRNKKKIRVVP